MAHSVMIGGTAYGIKGGKCLVDGTAFSIKRGVGLVDGTQVEYKFTVEPSLVINTKADFDNFVATAHTFLPGELVRVGANLNLLGAIYNSILFAGDFDGNNRMLMNAFFNPIDGIGGMFSAIGQGQKICNITLRNFTVNAADKSAGILVGQVEGTVKAPALLQNIQIAGGSVSNESYTGVCGGIAGEINFATIKYCGSNGTTINNGSRAGGLVGKSTGEILQSFSITEPNASTLYGGKSGGISGENGTGGLIESCWCTFETISGENFATQKNVIFSATEESDFSGIGLEEGKWSIEPYSFPILDKTNCMYQW